MSEALFVTKGYDKHGRVLLTQCMLPSVRALNKLFFKRKYTIYVLEGPK